MGIYSNASSSHYGNFFDALTGYLDEITKSTKTIRISVPYDVKQHETIQKKDMLILRGDDVLLGVRIELCPSSVSSVPETVTLTDKEYAEATAINAQDDLTERIKKSSMSKTKEVYKPSYEEAEWTIHIRSGKNKLETYSGTPFDTELIEKTFIRILDIVKGTEPNYVSLTI